MLSQQPPALAGTVVEHGLVPVVYSLGGRAARWPRPHRPATRCRSRWTRACAASASPPSRRSSWSPPSPRAGLRLAGVFTHLAIADEPNDPYTAEQLAGSTRCSHGWSPPGIGRRCCTPPNSAGAARPSRRSRSTWSASGSRSTASSPGPAVARCSRRPAPGVSLQARVSHVKRVRRRRPDLLRAAPHVRPADTRSPPCRSATPTACPAAWPRPVARCWCTGGARPIVGVVTMDQLMVDVGDAAGRGRRRGRAARPRRATRRSEPRSGPCGSARSPTRSSAGSRRACRAATARPDGRAGRSISIAWRDRHQVRGVRLLASSLHDTTAIAGALAGVVTRGDVVLLAGRDGRGQDRRSCRGSPLRSGSTSRSRHRRSTSCTPTTAGASSSTMPTSTAWNARRDRRPGPRRAARVRCAARRVGRGRGPATSPTGSIVQLLAPAPDDEDARELVLRPSGRAGRRAGAASWTALAPVAGGRVLVLGIETATLQVSVAIGGHEGVIGLFEVARGRHHAEALVPAIDFVMPPGRDRDARDRGRRRRHRARTVHRHAGRHRRGKGDRPGAASADDRHLQPRPAGVRPTPDRPPRRAGDRCPPRRGVLRRLSVGARRRAAPHRTDRRPRPTT